MKQPIIGFAAGRVFRPGDLIRRHIWPKKAPPVVPALRADEEVLVPALRADEEVLAGLDAEHRPGWMREVANKNRKD